MADQPPPENPGPWAEVLNQVREALDEAEINEPESRDALLEGVRQALETIEESGLLTAKGPASEAQPRGPEVTVVEGGRQLGDPPTGGGRPALRVATRSEAAVEPEPETRPPFRAQVRFFRKAVPYELQGGSLAPVIPISGLQVEGRIHLAGGEDAPWQTLFRGELARPYRVSCIEGALRMSLDGLPAERLEAGQTIDVEARLVRVSAEHPEGARGSYVRLPELRPGASG